MRSARRMSPALKRGLVNLEAHVRNVQKFGVPVVVALNRFTSDTDEELRRVLDAAKGWGARAALSEVWAKGGAGGEAVAREILAVLDEKKAAFKPLYDAARPIKEKIETIAREIYGAGGVDYTAAAEKNIAQCEAMGLGEHAGVHGQDPVLLLRRSRPSWGARPASGSPSGTSTFGRRRVRRGAGRRYHDHAGPAQDPGRRSDPGPCPTAPSRDCSDAIGFVSTAGAPKAIGPYSQAVISNGLPLHRRPGRARSRHGELVAGGIAEQTTRVLENLAAVLEAGGRLLAGGQDDRVPGRHGRLRRHERGLRPSVRRPPAGALDRGRRRRCRGGPGWRSR